MDHLERIRKTTKAIQDPARAGGFKDRTPRTTWQVARGEREIDRALWQGGIGVVGSATRRQTPDVRKGPHQWDGQFKRHSIGCSHAVSAPGEIVEPPLSETLGISTIADDLSTKPLLFQHFPTIPSETLVNRGFAHTFVTSSKQNNTQNQKEHGTEQSRIDRIHGR